MDLWGFLSWLFDRGGRVLTWFGDEFDNFLNTVTNTWHWITTQASQAYSNAVAWAGTEINHAFTTLSTVAKALEQGLKDAITYINTQIQQVTASLGVTLANVINTINATIQSIFNTLSGYITDAKVYLITLLNNTIHNLILSLDGWFNDTLAKVPLLQFLLTLLTPQGQSKLTLLINDLFTNLQAFSANPIGFILSSIWGVFLSFLSWVLGYGLGTTNRDMPERPNFDSRWQEENRH